MGDTAEASCSTRVQFNRVMPHYHFDIEDQPVQPDEEGCELPDDAAARSRAVKLAGIYLIEHPRGLLTSGEFGVRVRRPDRRTVYVVSCVAVDTSGL